MWRDSKRESRGERQMNGRSYVRAAVRPKAPTSSRPGSQTAPRTAVRTNVQTTVMKSSQSTGGGFYSPARRLYRHNSAVGSLGEARQRDNVRTLIPSPALQGQQRLQPANGKKEAPAFVFPLGAHTVFRADSSLRGNLLHNMPKDLTISSISSNRVLELDMQFTLSPHLRCRKLPKSTLLRASTSALIEKPMQSKVQAKVPVEEKIAPAQRKTYRTRRHKILSSNSSLDIRWLEAYGATVNKGAETVRNNEPLVVSCQIAKLYERPQTKQAPRKFRYPPKSASTLRFSSRLTKKPALLPSAKLKSNPTPNENPHPNPQPNPNPNPNPNPSMSPKSNPTQPVLAPVPISSPDSSEKIFAGTSGSIVTAHIRFQQPKAASAHSVGVLADPHQQQSQS